MQDLFDRLSVGLSKKQMKNHIKITIPIVIHTSGTFLDLKIKKNKVGFTIFCPTNIFSEQNAQGNQEYYFNIFEKNDKNYHYDIKIKNGIIFKDYPLERNINVAIDEFVRFYIMLDDFMMNNNVIGQEEKFE